MSVIVVIEPDFEFWQTGLADGLPEAVWRATGRVTGDATGGFQALQIDFQKSTLPLSGRMWSLEMLAANSSAGALQLGVSAFNLGEVLGAAPLVDQGYSVLMTSNSAGDAQIDGGDLTFLPWFMGAPRVRNVAAGVLGKTINTNLVTLDVWMRGFVWGPRSQTVAGGPVRPLGSVFGR